MMYNRALAGREKAWGPDHPYTFNTVNNLGILEDSEVMYNRALAGYEKHWDLSTHPRSPSPTWGTSTTIEAVLKMRR